MLNKYLRVKDHNNLFRDPASGSIMVADEDEARARHRERVQAQKKLLTIAKEHEVLKSDVAEIKSMLTQLLDRLK